MLILTRRVGETVMIGNDVTVTVLGVKGNQVRIGINAPRTSPSIGKRSSSASSTKGRRVSCAPDRPDCARLRTRTATLVRVRRLRALYLRFPRQYHGALSLAGGGAHLKVLIWLVISVRGEMAEWSKAHPC